MGLRKFSIWLVKNLIILLLMTFIFSTIALDAPSLIKGIFKDVFQYSTPEMQKEVVGKLTLTCSSLKEKDYDALQQEMFKGAILLDFRRIGALCKDYNGGKVNDKEFFFSVIGNAFPEKLESKSNALNKYNAITGFLNRNKVIYFIILSILLAMLYLLVMNAELYIITVTGISFSMGVLIILPYVAVMLYDKFVGINTTPILATIFSGNMQLGAKAIISVVLLMILRTYSGFIIVLGFLFLGIGIGGKIFSWKSRKQSKKLEEKPDKKSKKDKENYEDADEAYKHRDRTTKEILEELEEMHRKKSS